MGDAIYEKLLQSLRIYEEMNRDLSLEIENLTSIVKENREVLQKERQDCDASLRIIMHLEEMMD
ncbi:MAG: hypothetical protein M1375_03425 [Candidatus Thermoplasmatota archaeon]|nr:hypothetical protein [Candidatus Thermoplasmatota archaeon]MCL5791003.1 hypothetical protein [Candidatus Thermoplasmatota archaeon]